MNLSFASLQSVRRSLIQFWDGFFFTPRSATPVALYRIVFGLLVIADLALLHGDWLTWFGANGFLRVDTLEKLSPDLNLRWVSILLQNDVLVQGFFWVFLLFAVFLTVGFWSRLSSVLVFLFLNVIIRRNFYITNGGDFLMRAMGFFLIFAPSGSALSVDRLLRLWRGQEGLAHRHYWPWAHLLLQIETSLVYISAVAWKSMGADWINGTAIYYTSRLVEFQRFPMPTLENGLLLRLATWSTLLIEFAVGVLVWVPKLRYRILLLGVCLHLSLEYSMNIPLFQWIIMAGYVTFIDAADLSRAWVWIRRHFAGWLGEPVDVIYAGNSIRSVRLVNVLRAIDIFGRLNFTDGHSLEGQTAWPGLAETHEQKDLLIGTGGLLHKGFSRLTVIAHLVPLLWWLVPLKWISSPWKQGLPALKAAK